MKLRILPRRSVSDQPRRRRGSVLVLVVVMVLLLAILGTALISTTRGDRYTTAQHTVNTQIDLLMQGVKDLASARITGALSGSPSAISGTIGGPTTINLNFRPPMDTKIRTAIASYANFTGFEINDNPNDATLQATGKVDLGSPWLSQRSPSLGTFTAALGAYTSGYEVYWPNVTQWLTGNTFESPAVVPLGSVIPTLSVSPQFNFFHSDNTQPATLTNLTHAVFAPTYTRFNGQTFPAFNFQGTGGNVYSFVAGDADGDGIADSAFFKLPVGVIDGVTYYAAVKIVDMNSAINVNTAGSRSFDITPAQTANSGTCCDALGTPINPASAGSYFAGNLGWFQSHVGLQELLHRADLAGANSNATTAYNQPSTWYNEANAQSEMLSLRQYKLGYDNTTPAGQVLASGTMIAEKGVWPWSSTGTYLTAGTTSFQDNDGIFIANTNVANTGTISTADTNYGAASFLTEGDAIQSQLTWRIANPGLNVLSTTTAHHPYQAFSINDELSLAFRGGTMINYDIGQSLLERTFFNARSSPTFADSIFSSSDNYRNTSGASNVPQPGYLAGTTAFGSNDVAKWYDDYYNNDGTTIAIYNNTASGATTFSDNTTTPGTYRTLRTSITTWSPTSNLIQQKTLPAVTTSSGPGALAFPAAWNTTAAKTCINTADFSQLWRAYWNVMAEQDVGIGTLESDSAYDSAALATVPIISDAADDLYGGMGFAQQALINPDAGGPVNKPDPVSTNHERMFRSVIRDTRNVDANNPAYLPPASMVLVRSAIAAKQAEILRAQGSTGNGTLNPTAFGPRTITVPGAAGGTGVSVSYDVTVYGYIPQPFITEVFVQTFSGMDPVQMKTNPNGYVAFELYNPNSSALTLKAADYDMLILDKSSLNSTATLSTASTIAFSGDLSIPSHGYAVVDNFGGTGDATYKPGSANFGTMGSGTMPSSTHLYHADLGQALGKELIIRHHVGSGTSPTDYQPVDSFDFYSMTPSNGTGPVTQLYPRDYHYARPSGAMQYGGTAANNNWRCVYPGRYDGASNQNLLRQQGTQESDTFNPNATPPTYDPWDPNNGASPPGVAPGSTSDTHKADHAPVTLGADNDTATYDVSGQSSTFTIPLANDESPGPFPASATNNRFPFGGFAREGDMLQVPFIGAYTVTLPGATSQLVEMNSISMDAAFAEDTYTNDDEKNDTSTNNPVNPPIAASRNNSHEQIGRFCPIHDVVTAANNADDLDNAGTYTIGGTTALWNYRWCIKLFDYLTVHANQSDFFPNVSPSLAVSVGMAAPYAVDNDGDQAGNGIGTTNTSASPMLSGNYEEIYPNQGLININTASARVLSALPFLKTGNNLTYSSGGAVVTDVGSWSNAASPAGTDDNYRLAQEIVWWRDGKVDGTANYPAHGPFKSLFDLYRVPAFQAAQNYLLLTAPTTPPANDFTNSGPDSTMGDFSPSVSTQGDLARYDFEEQFFLLNRVSNLITTRSDSFIVYILLQGWKNVGTANPQLAVQKRAAFIQDRWQVYSTNSLKNAGTVSVPNE